MAILLLVPLKGLSQNWQSVFMLDSRSGYTTNTYLNPYLAEWDRSAEVGYLMFSPIGQLAFNTARFSTDFTAGAVYKPFFDERDDWSGVFGMMGVRYRISDSVTAGLESGGSQYSTFLDRDQYWIQPVVRWSPNLFTQVRLKAGSSFRKLSGEIGEEEQAMQRFDSYTFEFETWPNFQWQLRSSIFGNLDDPAANIGLRASVDHRITRTLQFSLNGGLERYQYQIITENGGGPPIGGPGGGSQIFDEADRLLRTGIAANYQMHKNVSVGLQADYLNYYSSATGESLGDVHVSAGIRLSLFPKIGGRGKADVEWKQNDTQTIILKLNYSGSGRLYLLGDFNDWEQPGIALSQQARNRYAVQLSLTPGIYEYKILLIEGSEEKWIDFSDDTYVVPDGFGGENGLIFID